MRPVWIIITLLALAPAVTVFADPVAGDFYAYRYSVSYGDLLRDREPHLARRYPHGLRIR
jgi:hypothetical protein